MCEIGGDAPIAARLPALLAALLLVGMVSGWITWRAGSASGLATAIVLATSPITVQMSVFARFYTFNALSIAIAMIAAFEAMVPVRSVLSRVLLAAICMTALFAAWRIQDTTVFAVLGL